MFYTLTNGEPNDLVYFAPFVSAWTPNVERAATFGSERAACDKAANLSREYAVTVHVREYGTSAGGAFVVATFTNGIRQP